MVLVIEHLEIKCIGMESIVECLKIKCQYRMHMESECGCRRMAGRQGSDEHLCMFTALMSLSGSCSQSVDFYVAVQRKQHTVSLFIILLIIVYEN